jgi:malonyl-CoA/methylmalonyl-CoA synthetase
MAVPTIYFKLIAYYNTLNEKEKNLITNSLKKFRLMVSGSAALPVSILKQWKKISGHTLLERYGMTEIGMAISNSYRNERKPGYIGLPLNEVMIRIADEQNQSMDLGEKGEIQVQGPNVFKEYWGKPKSTAVSFTDDGWFKTGDIAVFENGAYRILGRNSVDIIKSGGYKISALEIEEVLRTHSAIKECGVVGIPDEEWGEIIGASLVINEDKIDFKNIKNWLKEQLPAYKIPKRFIIQEDLPRNVMGKVTKMELKKIFLTQNNN